MKVKVEVIETLSRIVEVEVSSETEAEMMVRDMYVTEEIVLDGDDSLGADFKVVGAELSNNDVYIRYVSKATIMEIINTRKPLGNFLNKDGEWWVAVDNTTGRAWTEDFSDLEDAYSFLKI